MHNLIREMMPIGSKELRVELHVYEPNDDQRDRFYKDVFNNKLIIRLVTWDPEERYGGGTFQAVRDVKEQVITIPTFESEARFEFVKGLKTVLLEVITQYPHPEGLLVSDLLNRKIWEVTSLKTMRTEDDFASALRAKSRLGKYLRPTAKLPTPTFSMEFDTSEV